MPSSLPSAPTLAPIERDVFTVRMVVGRANGKIGRRERLGGMLNY